MGIGEDAVVDKTLKVRGVQKLRVADASIMPTVTSGNTNAPFDHDWRKGVRLHTFRRLTPSVQDPP